VLLHEGDPSRCVVLLPGVSYFSQAPLLWFAREAAQARGWSVVEVDERAPQDREPFEWMRAIAEEALTRTDAERVVRLGGTARCRRTMRSNCSSYPASTTRCRSAAILAPLSTLSGA
jgi:hypothetical protein